MPNKPAFADALRALVAKEVHAALSPYRDMLAALIEFAEGAPARPVSVGSAVVVAPGRKRHKVRAVGPVGTAVVGQFCEGQKVQYRQGRGTFDAKVIAIDVERGVLRLERDKDAKKVVRPASKVIAA